MSRFGRAVLRLLALPLAVALGGGIGLATAFMAVGGQPPFGAVRDGPWTAWPGTGGPAPDPYARAVAAREGRIFLATGAGLRFLATTDGEGRALVGRCDYAVSGPLPPAQAWTLTVLDPAGFPPAGRGLRGGFTSSEVVRALDGSFVVTVAAGARPGNWLPAERADRFTLMLSLYDTPLGTALRMGASAPAMPTIVRGACP